MPPQKVPTISNVYHPIPTGKDDRPDHPLRNRSAMTVPAPARRRKARARMALGLIALALLAGCGQGREEAGEAAMALAEAIYPGKLELHGVYLKKGYYETVLAVPADPVTRVRLDMDRNPANCLPGTQCETRLRKAYATGIALGQEIKALDATFRDCGVPVLSVTQHGSLVPTVTQQVTNQNQNDVLNRIAACATGLRDTNQGEHWWRDRRHMRILIASDTRQRTVGRPDPLSFEATMPGHLRDQPAYSAQITFEDDKTMTRLQFAPFYDLKKKITETIEKAATGFLRSQPDKVVVETMPMLWDTELDPERIDVVRTWMLACTEATREKEGPCRRGDVGLRVEYDFVRHEVLKMERVTLNRDQHGSVQFPPLPARPPR